MNKIGFIGGGKMATAIIKGIINSKWCEPNNIFVSDKNEQALDSLKENYQVSTTIDNLEVVKNSNIILLAVKPFVLRDVLNEIKDFVQKDTLVLSIAAGISIKTIQEILGDAVSAVVSVLVLSPQAAMEDASISRQSNTASFLFIFVLLDRSSLYPDNYITKRLQNHEQK